MKKICPALGSDLGPDIGSNIKNEKGSVMIIALLIMALLTIIGVSAINDTTTELQIARNDAIYKINFFQADGSARQAAQTLEDMPSPQTALIPATATVNWLYNSSFDPDQTWIYGTNAAQSDFPSNDAGFCVAFNAVVGGKDMTASTNLYDYRVFGRSSTNDGDCMVMTGYRIRF